MIKYYNRNCKIEEKMIDTEWGIGGDYFRKCGQGRPL